MDKITVKEIADKLYFFIPSVRAKEIKEDVEPSLDKKGLLNPDKQKFASYIYLPEWRELALVFKELDYVVDPLNQSYSVATSYHMQALRRGFKSDVTPIAISSVILTSDNNIVLGVRGGKVDSGQIGICPAGCLSKPLIETFHEELLEELGVVATGEPLLLGYQRDCKLTKGVFFMFYGQVDFSSVEIERIHSAAFTVYKDALERGALEIDARKAISQNKHLNVDAWEYSSLVFLENDTSVIQQVLEDGFIDVLGVRRPLRDLAVSALKLYLEFLRRTA